MMAPKEAMPEVRPNSSWELSLFFSGRWGTNISAPGLILGCKLKKKIRLVPLTAPLAYTTKLLFVSALLLGPPAWFI
jgi:hypothetical protein